MRLRRPLFAKEIEEFTAIMDENGFKVTETRVVEEVMALGIFGKSRSSSQTQVIETHILDEYILFKVPAVQKGEEAGLNSSKV